MRVKKQKKNEENINKNGNIKQSKKIHSKDSSLILKHICIRIKKIIRK